MSISELIDQYAAGPAALRHALAGMAAGHLDAAPIPGKWSTRQVVCHIADTEPLYTERMKRVIAEDRPTLFAVDPDRYAEHLAYSDRDLENELRLVECVRSQMVAILRTLPEAAFSREGIHSADGPLTLQMLLQRITNHVPHHIQTIVEKRRALGLS